MRTGETDIAELDLKTFSVISQFLAAPQDIKIWDFLEADSSLRPIEKIAYLQQHIFHGAPYLRLVNINFATDSVFTETGYLNPTVFPVPATFDPYYYNCNCKIFTAHMVSPRNLSLWNYPLSKGYNYITTWNSPISNVRDSKANIYPWFGADALDYLLCCGSARFCTTDAE